MVTLVALLAVGCGGGSGSSGSSDSSEEIEAAATAKAIEEFLWDTGGLDVEEGYWTNYFVTKPSASLTGSRSPLALIGIPQGRRSVLGASVGPGDSVEVADTYLAIEFREGDGPGEIRLEALAHVGTPGFNDMDEPKGTVSYDVDTDKLILTISGTVFESGSSDTVAFTLTIVINGLDLTSVEEAEALSIDSFDVTIDYEGDVIVYTGFERGWGDVF